MCTICVSLSVSVVVFYVSVCMYSTYNHILVYHSYRIFLVDHAWTFEAEYARRQLQSAPELLVRIAALTECVDENDQGSIYFFSI